MPEKQRHDPYRFADIIIAAIPGAVLGLTISLATGELLEPIVFHGDLILTFMVGGAIQGMIGGEMKRLSRPHGGRQNTEGQHRSPGPLKPSGHVPGKSKRDLMERQIFSALREIHA